MIRIDTESYKILGQKYALPSQKCGMSVVYFDVVGEALACRVIAVYLLAVCAHRDSGVEDGFMMKRRKRCDGLTGEVIAPSRGVSRPAARQQWTA